MDPAMRDDNKTEVGWFRITPALALGGSATIFGCTSFLMGPFTGFVGTIGSSYSRLISSTLFKPIAHAIPSADPKTRAGIASSLILFSNSALNGGLAMCILRSSLSGGRIINSAFFPGMAAGSLFGIPALPIGYYLGKNLLADYANDDS